MKQQDIKLTLNLLVWSALTIACTYQSQDLFIEEVQAFPRHCIVTIVLEHIFSLTIFFTSLYFKCETSEESTAEWPKFRWDFCQIYSNFSVSCKIGCFNIIPIKYQTTSSTLIKFNQHNIIKVWVNKRKYNIAKFIFNVTKIILV
jgi:hypothetical protein